MSVRKPVLKITPERVIDFPSAKNGASNKLRLQNLESGSVAFKIKTTAPKCYLVRPSTGVIAEGGVQEVNIQVTVQQKSDGRGPDHMPSSNDRFLVQSIPVTSDALPSNFWQNVDKTAVHDQRMNVAFRENEGATNGKLGSEADGVPPSVTVPRVSAPGAPGIKADTKRIGSPGPGFPREAGEGDVDTNGYQKLVNYCLAIERQKEALQKELDALKGGRSQPTGSAKRDGPLCANCGGSLGNRGGDTVRAVQGFEVWHVVFIVVAVVFALKVVQFY